MTRPPIPLTDLNAHFLGAGGPGITSKDGSPVPERRGVGVALDCPCGCGVECYVPFGTRTGYTIETLTLRPSVLRSADKGGCGWHGYITNGQAVTV